MDAVHGVGQERIHTQQRADRMPASTYGDQCGGEDESDQGSCVADVKDGTSTGVYKPSAVEFFVVDAHCSLQRSHALLLSFISSPIARDFNHLLFFNN